MEVNEKPWLLTLYKKKKQEYFGFTKDCGEYLDTRKINSDVSKILKEHLEKNLLGKGTPINVASPNERIERFFMLEDALMYVNKIKKQLLEK